MISILGLLLNFLLPATAQDDAKYSFVSKKLDLQELGIQLHAEK